VPRIIIKPNHQDAGMMTIRSEDHQLVQIVEVSVVSRQEGPLVPDGLGKMDLIAPTGQPNVGRHLDIVPVTAQ
jgi:hypothetical protein